MNSLIIGAGASSLSLALMIKDVHKIYESTHVTGGHCIAKSVDGWTFDRGPHIMFSRNTEVLDFMKNSLQGNIFQSKRNNKVFANGRMVKYPFENDLYALDIDDRAHCLLTYLFNSEASLADNPKNLDEWFVGNFGKGMTDLYFRPYNEKIWNVPLSELSMSWSDRIPLPPKEDVVKGALGVSTEGYLHQLYYHYPLEGGYQAITDAWTKMLPSDSIRLNTTVTKLKKVSTGVEVTTNHGVEVFDQVICTAPMNALLEMVGDVPDRVRDAVNALKVNSINVVTLGYRGEDKNKYTAVYYADPEYLPNRVSSPSVFSPKNAPEGCFSLQAEITFPPGNGYLSMSDSDLVQHVHNGYVASGLVEALNEPIFQDIQRFEHAYVVYTNGYEKNVQIVKDWAKSLGIIIHGRFGSFDYLNVDGCVIKSQELASELNGYPTSLPTIS